MENIYELLNRAEMNLEEFEDQKLSDCERKTAKKRVLREIRKMKNSKKVWKRTLAAAAACVCVVMGVSTISAAAGWLRIPDSFKTVFGINTDEELEAAGTMGASVDAVAEDHGYKISAEGILGDGKNMGIVFKIEKSDGSALLNNGEVPADVDFREIDHGTGLWLHAVSGNIEGSRHADCMEYYIAFTYEDSANNRVAISLEDMQLRVGGQQFDVSGKWEFDIPFAIQDVSVDLASGQKFRYGSSEGIIDELMVSPIGFSVSVTTAEPLTGSDFIDMPMEIHLNSKEVVELNGGCGPMTHDDGTWSWRQDGVYENMILLNRIKSIVIGDTEFVMNH